MPFFDIVSVHHCFREFPVFSSGLLVYKERPRGTVVEELEVKSRSEGIDAFIKQAEKAFAEKGEKGLKEMIAKNPQYWESIEENLEEMEASQRERIKRLLAEIRELQKQVVDLLPDYPVSKKVAVIVNGDSWESRHTGNTERTIRVLRGLGFEEFFVAQDEPVRDRQGVKQYPGTKSGMNRLFAELKGALKKDALVFMHGTGHGSRAEGGALAMDFVPVGVDEVKQYMQVIKGSGARIVGVFDSCYSGVFPRAIIEEKGLEGIVLSPGVENMTTACQAFTPYFFEGLEKGADLNRDNKTEVSEAFLAAMQIYCHRTGEETLGEFRKSYPELTRDNADKLLGGKKPVLVMYTSTWCHWCKVLKATLHKLDAVLGNQVETVTITDDTNPDARKLYKRLGIEPEGFPAVLLHKNGRTERLFNGAVDEEEFLALLSAEGIRPSEQQRGEAARTAPRERPRERPGRAEGAAEDLELEREVERKLGVKEGTIRKFLEKYGPNVFNLLRDAEEGLAHGSMEKINKAVKAGDMERFDRELDKLLKAQSLLALKYFSVYKNQPYAERVLGNAAEVFPMLAFAYFEHFKNRTYAERILTIAAEADPWAAIDFVESHKTLPYRSQILRKAQKSIAPK